MFLYDEDEKGYFLENMMLEAIVFVHFLVGWGGLVSLGGWVAKPRWGWHLEFGRRWLEHSGDKSRKVGG